VGDQLDRMTDLSAPLLATRSGTVFGAVKAA
jgi:hypothetical protein